MNPSSKLVWTILATASALLGTPVAEDESWPQWRGPNGDGISRTVGAPEHWSKDHNLRWLCPIPGEGASSPIVWDDAIFVTAQETDKLSLVKVERKSGKIAWTKQVGQGDPTRQSIKLGRNPDSRRRQKFHELHNMASPSPVTDGERVIVHFGNGDLAAYSFAGEQIWKRNLQEDHGPYTIWWGHANSPVLHRDLVISACMQDSLADLPGGQSLSYVVAHDKRTGKEVWKTSRMTSAKAEECDSYITPILRRNGNTTEVVLVGGDTLDAYNPATGDRLWHFPNLAKARIITGLCTHADLVFATRGMRGDLFALRPSGLGQLPISDQVWRHAPGTPDTCCPVATNGLLFWVSDNGVARCVDAATGSEHWAQRLGGEFKASPVIAEGRVHFLNTAGKCFVLAAKPNFQRLAENSIDDEMLASPAIVDGQIYLRGKKGLYCIGEK